jgi:transcriptional regulator with XRE-family HTH domain
VPPPRISKPISADHAALGGAIEAVMKEKGLKQDALAAATGMDIKQLGSYVRGQGNPTYTTVLRISRGLGVEPGRLLTIADRLRASG